MLTCARAPNSPCKLHGYAFSTSSVKPSNTAHAVSNTLVSLCEEPGVDVHKASLKPHLVLYGLQSGMVWLRNKSRSASRRAAVCRFRESGPDLATRWTQKRLVILGYKTANSNMQPLYLTHLLTNWLTVQLRVFLEVMSLPTWLKRVFCLRGLFCGRIVQDGFMCHNKAQFSNLIGQEALIIFLWRLALTFIAIVTCLEDGLQNLRLYPGLGNFTSIFVNGCHFLK